VYRGQDRARLKLFPESLGAGPLVRGKGKSTSLALGIAGRSEEARTILGKMLRIYPENPTVLLSMAESYMFEKKYAKVQEFLDRGLAVNPVETLLLINQGLVYPFTGRPELARAMLRKLESLQRESPSTYSQIFIHTALGEIDEAFKALNKASETHVRPFTIKTHPLFAELRKDPRFADFCKKIGIPN
jgi:tetratricopeptide (TPR) repeat protein